MGRTPSTSGHEADGLPPLTLSLVSERQADDDPLVMVYETTMPLEQLRGRFAGDVLVADRWCWHERRRRRAFGKCEGDEWRLHIRFGAHGHGRAVLELRAAGAEVVHRRVIARPSEDIRMAFQLMMTARVMPLIAQAVSVLAETRRVNRCKRRCLLRKRDGEVSVRASMFGRKG